jgi:polyisoprenyl-teichoic acid--peptidoglycan teichoic acid transferase
MRIPKIDLAAPVAYENKQKKVSRLAIFFFVAVLTIGGVSFSSNIIFSDNPIVKVSDNTFLGEIRTFVRSAGRKLQGEDADRINALILGIGGEGHDGPNLTDTMILVSYQPSTKKVALISIPRDLDVSLPGYGDVKINAINAYAEERQKGSGAEETAKAVSEVLNQPINYWVRIDFNGFEKAIDTVGGVDVTVDRSFVDQNFPVSDGSDLVKTVSFAAGLQHMDGATALTFARSRHGSNGEASDFARSKRQEKIIVALRDKLLSAGTLLNPATVQTLFSTFRGSVATNLAAWEIVRMTSDFSGIKTSDIKNLVMSDANVLTPTINNAGAFVLLPKNGDWQSVKDFVADAFNDTSSPEAIAAALPPKINIEVLNGTNIVGLAQKTASLLEAAGFTVSKVANADQKDYEKTVIYNISGDNTDAVTKLRTIIDANLSPEIPAAITPPDKTDFLIILGKNAAS